jgi:hypothetical protein
MVPHYVPNLILQVTGRRVIFNVPSTINLFGIFKYTHKTLSSAFYSLPGILPPFHLYKVHLKPPCAR